MKREKLLSPVFLNSLSDYKIGYTGKLGCFHFLYKYPALNFG